MSVSQFFFLKLKLPACVKCRLTPPNVYVIQQYKSWLKRSSVKLPPGDRARVHVWGRRASEIRLVLSDGCGGNVEALNNLNLGLLLENDHGCVLVAFVSPHRHNSAEN